MHLCARTRARAQTHTHTLHEHTDRRAERDSHRHPRRHRPWLLFLYLQLIFAPVAGAQACESMCACTRISTAVRVSTLIFADAAAPLYEGSTACAGTRAYGRRCSPYARAPAGKNACWPPLASVRPAHDCAGLRALQLVVAWRRSKEARKQHNCSRSATDPGAAAPLALDLSLAALNVARLLFEHLLGIGLLLPQPKELHDAGSRFRKLL